MGRMPLTMLSKFFQTLDLMRYADGASTQLCSVMQRWHDSATSSPPSHVTLTGSMFIQTNYIISLHPWFLASRFSPRLCPVAARNGTCRERKSSCARKLGWWMTWCQYMAKTLKSHLIYISDTDIWPNSCNVAEIQHADGLHLVCSQCCKSVLGFAICGLVDRELWNETGLQGEGSCLYTRSLVSRATASLAMSQLKLCSNQVLCQIIPIWCFNIVNWNSRLCTHSTHAVLKEWLMNGSELEKQSFRLWNVVYTYAVYVLTLNYVVQILDILPGINCLNNRLL